MIIAKGEQDGENVLLLGLSHENIGRLLAGAPIKISRRTHGDGVPDDLTLILLAGKDEQSIVSDLRKYDVITENTQEFRDNRLI